MTPEEKLKRLAESAAEFLKLPESNHEHTRWIVDVGFKPDWHISEKSFFEGHFFAPILMHLGKREAEKQDIYWEGRAGVNEYAYNCMAGQIINENEFIAFWSALLEAVKDD